MGRRLRPIGLRQKEISVISRFSYNPQRHPVVAKALAREVAAGNNISAYLRQAIEDYERQPERGLLEAALHQSADNGMRLLSIEKMLKSGIMPVIPDLQTDDAQNEMQDNLLSQF